LAGRGRGRVVVVVLDARVPARRDVRVDGRDLGRRRLRAGVAGADRPAGERIDPPAVEHVAEPAGLVQLLVVGQVAGGDGEPQPGTRAVALPHRAARVGVDAAHDLVEHLQSHRLLRAMRRPHLPARRIHEVHPGGRHLVRDLRIGQLGEVQERLPPPGPPGHGLHAAAATHHMPLTRRRPQSLERPAPFLPDRAVERRVGRDRGGEHQQQS
jgi:hypothetical protein